MFSIIIKDFSFDTIIGILDFERVLPQKVIVNCEITYFYEKNYLDYAKISKTIRNILQNKKFEVLEDSLDYICSYLKNEYLEIKTINLEILKPDILDDMVVGAKIIKDY